MEEIILVYCIIMGSQSCYLAYTYLLLKFGGKYDATILYEDIIFPFPTPKVAWVVHIEVERESAKCFLLDAAKSYKEGDRLEVYRWANFPLGAYDASTIEEPKRVQRCIKKTIIYTLLWSCLYALIYFIVKSFN